MNTALQDAIVQLNYGDQTTKIEALRKLEEQGIPALLNGEVLRILVRGHIVSPITDIPFVDDLRPKF